MQKIIKVLVDVNIFQDVLEAREGWLDSLEIFNLIKQKKIKGEVLRAH